MSFIDGVLAKVFGTKTDREVKAMLPTVAAIGALEPEFRELSDIDLAAKTIEFKEQIAQGATLDDLMIPAFAVVREAGRRALNMRHFDVQLIGDLALLGKPLLGHVMAERAGHAMHAALVARIMSDPTIYEILTFDQLASRVVQTLVR